MNENSLEEKIISLLKSMPNGLNSKKIAQTLRVSKKDVNKILFDNKDKFKFELFCWKLK